jgi:hypothetical protein
LTKQGCRGPQKGWKALTDLQMANINYERYGAQILFPPHFQTINLNFTYTKIASLKYKIEFHLVQSVSGI